MKIRKLILNNFICYLKFRNDGNECTPVHVNNIGYNIERIDLLLYDLLKQLKQFEMLEQTPAENKKIIEKCNKILTDAYKDPLFQKNVEVRTRPTRAPLTVYEKEA